MFQSTGSIKRVLWWLVAGSRGGRTRGRIIIALRGTPQNANQLADALGMDYKTIRHHLEILGKSSIIVSVGNGYGRVYFLSNEVEENYAFFEEIWGKIGNRVKNR